MGECWAVWVWITWAPLGPVKNSNGTCKYRKYTSWSNIPSRRTPFSNGECVDTQKRSSIVASHHDRPIAAPSPVSSLHGWTAASWRFPLPSCSRWTPSAALEGTSRGSTVHRRGWRIAWCWGVPSPNVLGLMLTVCSLPVGIRKQDAP